MAKLEKSVRIAGQSRTQLAADLKTQYEQGASIRELARATGRSYGFIHAVLTKLRCPCVVGGSLAPPDPPHSPVKVPRNVGTATGTGASTAGMRGFLVPGGLGMVTCRRGWRGECVR